MKQKFHIIGGTGKMGSWLKIFLEVNGFSVTVSGSKDTRNNHDISQAECIVFSVPIKKASELIKEIAPLVKHNCLLIDLSSITTPSVQALQKTGLPSLAMHCMFGPSIPTIANQKIVFIEVKGHPIIEELKELFLQNQATVVRLSAEEHDTTTAYIQALTHFVNLMMAEILEPYPFKITTPAFLSQYALITKIISNNSSELLTDIQIFNPYFRPLLKNFIQRQQYVLSLLENNDEKKLQKHYAEIQKKAKIDHKRELIKTQSNELPKNFQKPDMIIGYLGPEGTYSHQATKKLFTKYSPQLLPEKTIYDIFESIASRKIYAGVVPAENSTEGTVRETLDYLVQFNLQVNGSIDLPIHHCLLSKEKKLTDIKKIIAHPQALAQCREWLNINLPQAKRETATSNIAGIEQIKNEPGIAIIGPEQAAEIYNLTVLAKNIQDNPNNTTRFYLISPSDNYEGTTRTLLFVTVLNRVGVLRDILTVFEDFDINLSKIESRPSKEKNWDYYFFIEIDSAPSDPITHQAIDLLRQFCQTIKILGGI